MFPRSCSSVGHRWAFFDSGVHHHYVERASARDELVALETYELGLVTINLFITDNF